MTKILEEKKNDLITRAEEVLNKAKEEKRELTEAEATELTSIRDEVQRIRESIKLEDEINSLKEVEKKRDNEPKEEEKVAQPEVRMVTINNETLQVREDEYKAFEAYIRGFERDGTATNLTKGDNGAVIPTTVVNWIIRKVYDICPILDRSQKYNVKGNLQIPFYPADSNNINVAYAEEFTQLTSSSGKFGSVTLTGYLAGALTKVSRSLINNSNIDIVAFVVDEMAYAIKRFIEHEMLIGTAGTGSGNDGKVLGLSTLENGVTTASASVITADEVIELHDKIKDEFQQNAIWIMSPATRTALRQLKDGINRYLLQDDISLPFGTSILGKPVFVSDNMPDIEDGGAVIYYGDMRGLATKFSEDINIQVLRERFADEHADGVIGWFEFDAKVVDEQQIAKLTMASSTSV